MNLFVPSVDTVRRRVSVPAAAAHLGLEGQGDHYLCPFHEDSRNPNLVALPPRDGDPVHRFFCNSCGAKGDSLDLIRRVLGLSYTDALRVAGGLIGDEPELRSRPEAQVPTPDWDRRVDDCVTRALEPRNLEAGLLAYAAGWEADSARSEFLARTLEWGLDEAARVVMPHRAHDGTLTAVKVRCHPPEPRFRAHGPLRHLYLSHLADPTAAGAVVLCEGESDTAHAAYAVRDRSVDALGLPSGAQSFREEWLDLLRLYPTVFVAIDPDQAGQPAAARWVRELASGEPMTRVHRLPIRDGEDLRSCGVPVFELCLQALESRIPGAGKHAVPVEPGEEVPPDIVGSGMRERVKEEA